MPSKKALHKKRSTVLNAKQDIQFTIRYHLTDQDRIRMKKEFRSLGIDFFCRNRLRKALIAQLAPQENWTYKQVVISS